MGERWKPLQSEEPVKTPISKTQRRKHMKSVFDELELVMEINTSSKILSWIRTK